MKKHILLAVAVAAATPAFAQTFEAPGSEQVPFGSNYMPGQLIDNIAAQVDRYARSGILSRNEVQHWNGEVTKLRQLERRYSRGGLNDRERADLVRRADAVRQRLLADVDPRYARALLRPVPDDPVSLRSRVDGAVGNRLDPGRSFSSSDFQSRLDNDDGRNMNDLRGPAPDKHDEGSGLD